MTRALMHDDDILLTFEATQDARHAAVLRMNEMAKALVERARANAAGQQPDDDGVVPGPGRLRMVIGYDRDEKSAKQRRFLHGPVLAQIEERGTANGQRFDRKVWKEYLRATLLGHTWEMVKMPGQKRATPRKVRISTEDLSVKQYSDYIDRVLALAATEFGVEFDLDPIEREEVRYVRPARKREISNQTQKEAACTST